MPIRPEFLPYYRTPLWRTISRYVRFSRAKGSCEACGRRHGQKIYSLPDGRICEDGRLWCHADGREAPYPDLVEFCEVKITRVWLQAAHLNQDPRIVTDDNLASLCQRCHLKHDKPFHVARSKRTRKSKKAIGDLFEAA